MRTLNQIHLRGFLSDKPTVRSTVSQKKVANFVLITHKTKMVNGEATQEADFHRIVLWKGLADVAEKYLSKGDAVHVIGEVHYERFEGKDKKINYTTEIVADRLDLIKTKKEGAEEETKETTKEEK